MNRAQRRAAGRGFHCGICGSERVDTQDSRHGWVCAPCYDAHAAVDNAIAAAGNIIFHRVSPDRAPMPCSGLDCGSSAVVVFHVYEYGVAGCEAHIDAAYEATQRIQDGAA